MVRIREPRSIRHLLMGEAEEWYHRQYWSQDATWNTFACSLIKQFPDPWYEQLEAAIHRHNSTEDLFDNLDRSFHIPTPTPMEANSTTPGAGPSSPRDALREILEDLDIIPRPPRPTTVVDLTSPQRRTPPVALELIDLTAQATIDTATSRDPPTATPPQTSEATIPRTPPLILTTVEELSGRNSPEARRDPPSPPKRKRDASTSPLPRTKRRREGTPPPTHTRRSNARRQPRNPRRDRMPQLPVALTTKGAPRCFILRAEPRLIQAPWKGKPPSRPEGGRILWVTKPDTPPQPTPIKRQLTTLPMTASQKHLSTGASSQPPPLGTRKKPPTLTAARYHGSHTVLEEAKRKILAIQKAAPDPQASEHPPPGGGKDSAP